MAVYAFTTFESRYPSDVGAGPALEMMEMSAPEPKLRSPEEIARVINELALLHAGFLPGIRKSFVDHQMKAAIAEAESHFLKQHRVLLRQHPNGFLWLNDHLDTFLCFLNSQNQPQLYFIPQNRPFHKSKEGVEYRVAVQLSTSMNVNSLFQVFHSASIVPKSKEEEVITHTTALASRFSDSTYAEGAICHFDYIPSIGGYKRECWLTPGYPDNLFDYLHSRAVSGEERLNLSLAFLRALLQFHRAGMVHQHLHMEILYREIVDSQVQIRIGGHKFAIALSDTATCPLSRLPSNCAPEIGATLVDLYAKVLKDEPGLIFDKFFSRDAENLLKTCVRPNIRRSNDVWGACLLLLDMWKSEGLMLYLPATDQEPSRPFSLDWFNEQCKRYSVAFGFAAVAVMLRRRKHHEIPDPVNPLSADEWLIPPDPSHPLYDILELVHRGLHLDAGKRPKIAVLLEAFTRHRQLLL